MNLIGENLRKLRESNFTSQEKLSNELHTTRQAISNWERGLSEPDIETIKKICNYFDVDVNDFVSSNIEIKRTWKRSIIFSSLFMILSLGLIIYLTNTSNESSILLNTLILFVGHILIYAVSFYAFTTNDFSFFAGFDSRKNYNTTILYKTIENLVVYTSLGLFTSLITFYLLITNEDSVKYATVVLYGLYFLILLIVLVVNNLRYNEKLYTSNNDLQEDKAKTKVFIAIALQFVIIVGLFIYILEVFGIENNTSEAFKMVVILLSYIVVIGIFWYKNFKKIENKQFIANRFYIYLVIMTLIYVALIIILPLIIV